MFSFELVIAYFSLSFNFLFQCYNFSAFDHSLIIRSSKKIKLLLLAINFLKKHHVPVNIAAAFIALNNKLPDFFKF